MPVSTRQTYRVCSIALLTTLMTGMAAAAEADPGLSALLKQQTQEFSEAGQRGDREVMERLLDDAVVFTNETGEIVTKQQILADAAPLPGDRHIEVTHWALTPQGDVATATFIDVLQLASHGQHLEYRYQSTETWARRSTGWKMIASHTMVVPQDPPAVALPAAELDAYVGTYELDATLSATITRQNDALTLSTNGAAPIPLKVEVRDVLFTPGDPGARRIIERDRNGRVSGYISRRNGNDVHFRKVS